MCHAEGIDDIALFYAMRFYNETVDFFRRLVALKSSPDLKICFVY